MQLGLTICGFNASSNPGLFSQRHLESSPITLNFMHIFNWFQMDIVIKYNQYKSHVRRLQTVERVRQ